MTEKKRSNDRRINIPELLAPAGNLEKLRTAVHYGADAVYLGGKQLSLRAKAGNFTLDEITEGVGYAHDHGAKVYAAVNILAHNADIHGLEEYLSALSAARVDGLIIADPGILQCARMVVPHIPIHLSTQANVTNHLAADFWFRQGAGRLNLARELSFQEIREIRREFEGELEVFIHGAICISYSGRCMLSNYLTDRDANRGSCSHPCRFSYAVTEEKRPGQFFPVEEDSRGTYIFNSKDLCLLQLLPELVATGVDSLKIEGRMKSIFYVGGVVRVYRAALDYLAELPASAWHDPASINIPDELVREIEKTGTRGITENFAKGKPTDADMLFSSSRAEQLIEPVAVIRSDCDPLSVEIRNKLEIGEKVEFMGRAVETQQVTIESMVGEDGKQLLSANPGNRVRIVTNPKITDYSANDMIRRYKRVHVEA